MQKLQKLTVFTICLLFSFFTQAQIVINEYSCSNSTNYADANGNFEDWIELYNAGGAAVNLSGYYLSDDATTPMKWVIPAGANINPGGYLIFFASSLDGLISGEYHTNFKLTQTSLEDIVIADPTGIIIDQVLLNPTRRNHARARLTDGAATWGVATPPTPNATNTGVFDDYVPKPVFGLAPGFYPAAQNVTLTCSDPLAEIRYTTDGTLPGTGSTLYAGAINVAATTLIRARTFRPATNFAPSFAENNTYFINENHTLPVISVGGAYATTLFNNSQDIQSTFELYDGTPAHVFQHEGDGEMRRHGNDSWAFPQKGIRFHTQDEYGYANNIPVQLFANTPRDKYDVLIIKAAGSDNYTGAYDQVGALSTHLRDGYNQTLTEKYGLNMDTRRYQSCVLYINGQYWGLYEMRDRVDSDYTDYYYNQGDQNVDILKYWGGLTIENGTDTGWVNIFNYITGNNMAIQSNYNNAAAQFDVMSLIDYFILNTYTVNTDWLNWNTMWWRGNKNTPNTPKVKWKYALWDMDNTFNLGQGAWNYTGVDDVTATADPCDVEDQFQNSSPNVGHVQIFNALWANQIFKDLYINRYADLSNTAFSCDTMLAHLQGMVDVMLPEMPQQIARWGGSLGQWNEHLDSMRVFMQQRCALLDSGIIDCYQVTGPFPVTVQVVPAGAGTIQVNTITPPLPYTGDYFGGVNVSFQQTPTGCYTFDYWEVLTDTLGPNANSDSIGVFLDTSITVIAHYIANGFVDTDDTTLCQPTPITMTACGTTYSWTTSINPVPFSNLGTITVNPLNTTTYYIETNLGKDTVTITVSTTPNFQLPPDGLHCDQNPLVLNPTVLPNPANMVYTWQDNSTAHSYNVTTSGTYILTIDNNGCVHTDTTNLTLSTTPTVNFGPDRLFCDGTANLLLDAGTYAGATYTWQDNSAASTFNATADATYSVVVNNNGCIDGDTISLVFSVTPTVDLGRDSLYCDGTGNVLLNAGNYPSATYLWQDASIASTYNVVNSGQYYVTVNNKGCIDRDTVTLVLSVTPIFDLGPDLLLCDSDPIVLNTGNYPNATHLWQDGSTNDTYTVAITGFYYVAVDNQGCKASDSVHIFMGKSPIIYLGADKIICPDETLRLGAEISGVDATWQDGSHYLQYYTNSPGIYSVELKDAAGCVGRDTIVLLSSPLLSFDLGEDKTLCYGDSLILVPNVPNNSHYNWSTGLRDTALLITTTGTYRIDVIQDGCNVSDEMRAEMLNCITCQVYVPSAFTPNNGDDFNNLFFVSSNCPFGTTFELTIINRDGSKIATYTNPTDSWDGKIKGQNAPEGVYMYNLKCSVVDEGNEREVQKTGTITVIR